MPNMFFLVDILNSKVFWKRYKDDDVCCNNLIDFVKQLLDDDILICYDVVKAVDQIETSSKMKIKNRVFDMINIDKNKDSSLDEMIDKYYNLDIKGLLPDGCKISNEQWNMISYFEQKNHIMCHAVAGAGKTTTLLLCTRRFPDKKYLILTYNKRLQLDAQIKSNGKVPVYTFHAIASRLYAKNIKDDTSLKKVIVKQPSKKIYFDVIMIDEAQDMTIEYYILVRFLIRNNPSCQIIIVGDELQAINEYKGANREFLTKADRIYEEFGGKWINCKLSISQRLTKTMAKFVNNQLYKSNIIVGGNTINENVKPIYLSLNFWIDSNKNRVKDIIDRSVKKFGCENIFILAASVRELRKRTGKEPLIAWLIRCGLSEYPIYVSGNDDEVLNQDLIKGKLAILSFNAVKGCERKCVILISFDESYFKYFGKKWDNIEKIPNVLTMAATRASSLLIVISQVDLTMRTVNLQTLTDDVSIFGNPPAKRKILGGDKEYDISVTNLVRHQKISVMEDILNNVKVEDITTYIVDKESSKINCVIKFGDLMEDLRFIYGILPPVMAEVYMTGKTDFGEGLEAPTIVPDGNLCDYKTCKITKSRYEQYPDNFWENVTMAGLTDADCRSVTDWVYLAMARHAMIDGRYHLARQVLHYDWVDNSIIEACKNTIISVIGKYKGTFEYILPKTKIDNKVINGIADFYQDNGTIWEFKFTDEIKPEYVVQLICYLALNGGGEGILLSIPDGKAKKIIVSKDKCTDVLKILVNCNNDDYVSVEDIIKQYDSMNICDENNTNEEEYSSDLSVDDLY